MTDNYTEMVHVLEKVAKVNQAVTLPFIQKKTGLEIINPNKDHETIVTEADLNVSRALLDGNEELGVEGFRKFYSGSFSEENDSQQEQRLATRKIWQIDPLDGTGDFVDTYQTSHVMGPTTLISKLQRNQSSERFSPTSGLIFDCHHEFALISDGIKVGLFKVDEQGKVKEVPFERTEPTKWQQGDLLRLNQRVSYSQLNFDGPFIDFLKNERGLNVEQVPIGGAGIAAMQVFRNYFQPNEHLEGFSNLAHLTAYLNAQPDHKTWDLDPSIVIGSALGLVKITDIYGEPLTANAASQKLKDMHHTKGYILSPGEELRCFLVEAVKEFENRNPNCPILKTDYLYTRKILALRE